MSQTPDEVPFHWWEEAKEMLARLALRLGADADIIGDGDCADSYSAAMAGIAALEAQRDELAGALRRIEGLGTHPDGYPYRDLIEVCAVARAAIARAEGKP